MTTMVRRDRAFWEKTVRDFHKSNETHESFAQRQGVSLAALRYWLYKLRAEAGEASAVSTPVRILPVTVTGATTADVVELAVEGVVVRFRAGTAASYVAQLVAALRGEA